MANCYGCGKAIREGASRSITYPHEPKPGESFYGHECKEWHVGCRVTFLRWVGGGNVTPTPPAQAK